MDTTIIYDNISWEPKGHAFIEMKENKDALAALKELNGMRLNGKHIKVQKAKTRLALAS